MSIEKRGEKKRPLSQDLSSLPRIKPENRLLLPTYAKDQKIIQVKALKERPAGYPERFPIAPGTTWQTLDRDSYHPPDITSDEKVGGHPKDPRHIKGYPNFFSSQGIVLDEDGRPLNTMGPTGLKGPLIKEGKRIWGARRSVDGGITVEEDSKLHILVVKRTDSGEWALPGGGIEEGEDIIKALNREIKEESGVEMDFTNGTTVYVGGVDDKRNTDNFWPETHVRHLNAAYIPMSVFQTQEGETSDIKLMVATEEDIDSLFGSHPHFAKLIIKHYEESTGLVVAKDGTIGLP